MSASGRDPLLSVESLRAGYGESNVLRGVDLAVAEGEVVSLVGRNGVGKTTTLNCINGTLTPRGGTVRYRGEDVTGDDPVAMCRRGVGLVPEERRVFPGLTVRENLTVGRLGGSDSEYRRDVDEVLATFESLAEREHSRGANLSGGEQQMLSIARALVAGADLLLLDEPTEGLAPFVVREVEDLVRELNDEGITVLLVEQNVRVAMELADRVSVLDEGRIVFEGTPADLEADEDVMDRHLGVALDG